MAELSGKTAGKCSASAVALAIRNELVTKLIKEPKAVSDSMMTLSVTTGMHPAVVIGIDQVITLNIVLMSY